MIPLAVRIADYVEGYISLPGFSTSMDLSILPGSSSTRNSDRKGGEGFGRKDRVVLSTLRDGENELDWNKRGTAYVEEYLDALSSRHMAVPPFSIGLQDPHPFAFSVGAFLSSFLLGYATRLRVTSPKSVKAESGSEEEDDVSKDLFEKSIPDMLEQMESLHTLVLDTGSVTSLLPSLRRTLDVSQLPSTFLPSTFAPSYTSPAPLLPNLAFIVLEGVPMDWYAESTRILREYVEWRSEAGFPVNVVHVGMASGTGFWREAEVRKARRRGVHGWTLSV